MPKYMEIVMWVKEQLVNGQFEQGDKFYTEMELAEKFSISRQTIRRAFEELVREGLIDRVHGSGTYVAHKQTSVRSMNIGVISTYLDAYIFPSTLQGIETVLTQHGYTLQFALTNNKVANEARALRDMLEKDVDGLIVEPTKSGLPGVNLPLYGQLLEKNIPIVFFNAHYRDLDCPYVALDDENAGYTAAEHLIRAGHTRLAGIFLLDDMQGHLRYLGYLKALIQSGIKPRDGNILWYSTEDIPEFFSFPELILNRIAACSAIVCYNDQLAIRLMEFLRRQGRRVPEDISVIGIDNCDLAAVCDPPLTSLAHPKQVLGQAAAEMLIRRIGGSDEKPLLFKPELIERGSVAAAPGQR